MSLVLPGLTDVCAIFLLHSILISEDLPTLLLPIKANSGKCVLGHLSTLVLLMAKSALLTCMISALQFFLVRIYVSLFFRLINIINANHNTSFFYTAKVFVNSCSKGFHGWR